MVEVMLVRVLCKPQQKQAFFEVDLRNAVYMMNKTMSVLGMWDHNIGNS